MDCVRPYQPELASTFGEVNDVEMLSRIVSSPSHMGKDRIKASAIPNSHIRTGLSLVRMGFLPKRQFDEIAYAISATLGNANVPAGVIQASAGALRAFLDATGEEALCIFDDATRESEIMPENMAHSIAIQKFDYTEDQIVGIKTELMEVVFTQMIKLESLTHPDS